MTNPQKESTYNSIPRQREAPGNSRASGKPLTLFVPVSSYVKVIVISHSR